MQRFGSTEPRKVGEHSGIRTLNKDRFNARRTQDYRRFHNDNFDKAAVRHCRDRGCRFGREVRTHRSDCTAHVHRSRAFSHSRAASGTDRGAAEPVTHARPSRTIAMPVHFVGDTRARLSAVCEMLEQTCAVASELLSGASIRSNEIDSIVVSADLRVVENISASKPSRRKWPGYRNAFSWSSREPAWRPCRLMPSGSPCAGRTRQSATIAEAADRRRCSPDCPIRTFIRRTGSRHRRSSQHRVDVLGRHMRRPHRCCGRQVRRPQDR